MATEDYFRGGGVSQDALRTLLEREAARVAPRFGMPRRQFLNSAMGAVAASSALMQAAQCRSTAEAQDSFEAPSEDCYAEVEAAHARFLRSDESSQLDWEIIRAASHAQQKAVPDTVLNMLRANRTLFLGFAVSRLEHSLQTATRAVRANASDETVLIALVHDAAEILSGVNHAEVAAALLRPYVSGSSYAVVRTHMEFQLWHYGDKVGQPADLRDRYADQPWFQDAVTFSDAWDQVAFDPTYESLPLAEFEPLVRQFFGRVPLHEHRTTRDCLTPG